MLEAILPRLIRDGPILRFIYAIKRQKTSRLYRRSRCGGLVDFTGSNRALRQTTKKPAGWANSPWLSNN